VSRQNSVFKSVVTCRYVNELELISLTKNLYVFPNRTFWESLLKYCMSNPRPKFSEKCIDRSSLIISLQIKCLLFWKSENHI
jgi:hypothetical protein